MSAAGGVLQILAGGRGERRDGHCSGGTEIIGSGGLDLGATVSSGGAQIIMAGGTAIATSGSTNANMIIKAGGLGIMVSGRRVVSGA